MQISRDLRCGSFWLVLVGIQLAMICITVLQLGMIDAKLSPRHSDYAIPVAISKLRGLSDYTAYMDVAAFFHHHKQRPISDNIRDATNTKIVNPDYRLLVSGDDKGLVDLVYLSFRWFGSSISSIFIMVALIGAASIALYIFEFFRSPSKMALLVAVLASFYAILFTFSITDQSTSVIEPRFIGFLGIIPLLHVCLAVLPSHAPSIPSRLTTIAQILILFFVVNLRTSEIWQILCVVIACIIALVLKRDWRAPVGTVVIIALLGIALAVYRTKTYNREYQTTDLMTRVFWHNAIMGLSANQDIQNRFKIEPLNDTKIAEAVKEYLATTRQKKELELLFSNPNYASGNFSGFNWSTYETKARELYFRIVSEMPLAVLKAYLISMPRILVANISYMSGYPIWQDAVWRVGAVDSPEQRMERQRFLDPFRSFALLGLGFAALVLATSRQIISTDAMIAMPLIILGSMIPPAIVMPVFQYSQVTIMLMLTGCYVVILFGSAALIQLSLRRSQGGKSVKFA